MTSLMAAGGSGRSTSVIPAVPAAWSVTTIAFIWDTSLYQSSSVSVLACWAFTVHQCAPLPPMWQLRYEHTDTDESLARNGMSTAPENWPPLGSRKLTPCMVVDL